MKKHSSLRVYEQALKNIERTLKERPAARPKRGDRDETKEALADYEKMLQKLDEAVASTEDFSHPHSRNIAAFL